MIGAHLIILVVQELTRSCRFFGRLNQNPKGTGCELFREGIIIKTLRVYEGTDGNYLYILKVRKLIRK